MFCRCELIRDSVAGTGYFAFGLWGKQDLSKYKENIPISAILDNSTASFPNDIRQDIPFGRSRGKYKAMPILVGGQVLPDSTIDRFDIVTEIVDDNLMR